MSLSGNATLKSHWHDDTECQNSHFSLLSERYRFIREFAQGGTSHLYLAFDTRKHLYVIIKELRPALARRALYLSRFLAERDYGMSISHPRFLKTYSSGITSRKTPFLVVEYFSGITLSQLLSRQKQSKRNFDSNKLTIEIMKSVLEGVAYLHSRGLVHGDLKPGNIFVCPGSHRVKIGDFGSVRKIGERSGSAVLGTVSYASPEGILDKPVTPSSDIYAVALIGFELLTLKRPFQSVERFDIAFEQIAREVPRISSLNKEVLPWLEDLILKSLQKNPNSRCQSAVHFSQLIEAALEQDRCPALKNSRTNTCKKWCGNISSSRKILETIAIIAGVILSGILAVLGFKLFARLIGS